MKHRKGQDKDCVIHIPPPDLVSSSGANPIATVDTKAETYRIYASMAIGTQCRIVQASVNDVPNTLKSRL